MIPAQVAGKKCNTQWYPCQTPPLLNCVKSESNPNASFSTTNQRWWKAKSHQHSSRPTAEEPPHGHGRAEHHSRKTAADNSSAESDVEHLHAVALTATVNEAVGVVCARELPALGYRDLEEVAQRLPAFTHLVLEQVFRGHERADLIVVFVETALAVLLKVAFPELGPEFCGCISIVFFL